MQHAVVQFGQLLDRPARQVGIEPAGQDDIDLNIIFGPGYGQAFGELHHPAFTRCISQYMAAAEDRVHRAVVDDFATAGLFHRLVDRLRAQKRAAQIGLQDTLPLRRCKLVRLFANIDTGVVDQNINSAKCSDRLGHHGLNIVFLTDIHLQFEHLDAVLLAKRSRGFRCFRRTARGNRDIGSGGRQPLRHAATQAAVATRDNRHLTTEIK